MKKYSQTIIIWGFLLLLNCSMSILKAEDYFPSINSILDCSNSAGINENEGQIQSLFGGVAAGVSTSYESLTGYNYNDFIYFLELHSNPEEGEKFNYCSLLKKVSEVEYLLIEVMDSDEMKDRFQSKVTISSTGEFLRFTYAGEGMKFEDEDKNFSVSIQSSTVAFISDNSLSNIQKIRFGARVSMISDDSDQVYQSIESSTDEGFLLFKSKKYRFELNYRLGQESFSINQEKSGIYDESGAKIGNFECKDEVCSDVEIKVL